MSCRWLLAFALSLLLCTPVVAQHRGYYNSPDIHGDVIVFSSEGDLWRVPVGGGLATRLTTDPGVEWHPRISPDGKRVAFAAQYDGNVDVYVMPMDGGAPTRLTWHPYADLPTGWTPDGKYVLHQSARQHPETNRMTFMVPAEGGVPSLLPIGSSSYTRIGADGNTVIFNRNYLQPRTWQRYGGGLADDVWIGDLKEGRFTRLTSYFGNDLSPMFAGDRIFFTSERDGRMNLWSVTAKGKDLQQHTRFTDFDVRHPSSDGGTQVVFQQGADIYLYDVAKRSARKVEIELPTDRVNVRLRNPEAKKFVEDAAISNDGRKTLFSIRGDLFNIPAKTGRPISLTTTQGVRETSAVFAGKDEDLAVYFSDKSGDYEIYKRNVRTGEGEQQVTKSEDPVRKTLEPFFPITVAPDGENIAFADQRGTLYWTNLTTQTLTLVDRSSHWELSDYEWSPDGRYIAYAKYMENDFRRLYIYDVKTKEARPVSDEMYDSFSPTWDPSGEYLFYLSGRTFNRQAGAFEYETIMKDPTAVYAILLNGEVKNPFRKADPYEEDDEKKQKEEKDKKEGKGKGAAKEKVKEDVAETTASVEAAKKKEKEKEDEKKVEVKIEFEGILDRHIAFPMESGNLSGLVAVKDRVFYFAGDDGPNLMVYAYKKDKPEAKVFATKVDSYSISRNREHLMVRSGDGWTVTAASADKPGEEDPSPDLSRIRLTVDPVAEWKQILREAYRYNRDYFYLADMTRVDWPGAYERYRPLLDRISTRQELTDIVGNLIAELGHGHTYVFGHGDAPAGREMSTGLLACDFDTMTSPSVVLLKRIYRGERWNPALQSPLNTRETAKIPEGAVLVAVNGRKVTTDVDPLSHFWGLGGEEALLTIADDPTTTTTHDYRVTLLKEDAALREADWVKRNREYVASKTNGEIGYIYLPDMGTPGLVAFFREFFPQVKKKAMVVDVRWNGGGNVSQLLIRRLRQQLYAMSQARNFEDAETYPSRVFTGPMACLINQYSGSDGDIFPHSFRHFNLGPLIGKRTWGGTVGIRGHTRFVDGGGISVPEFAFIGKEAGYDIENYGVDPDEGFEVDLTPEDEIAGRDPQLDRAIEYLLKEMKKEKYQVPISPKARPDRSTESFRKRSRDWMDRP